MVQTKDRPVYVTTMTTNHRGHMITDPSCPLIIQNFLKDARYGQEGVKPQSTFVLLRNTCEGAKMRVLLAGALQCYQLSMAPNTPCKHVCIVMDQNTW